MSNKGNKKQWDYVPKPVYTAQITADHGRFPPQALDIEEAILGAVMLEKDAFETASEIITSPDFFYKPAHQTIWQAITLLSASGEPVDILTVTNKLKEILRLDDVGGPYYITKLTSRVGSAVNIEYHCRIVAEKFMRRNIIYAASELNSGAYDDQKDVLDLVDSASDIIYRPVENLINVGKTDSFNMFQELFRYLENVYAAKDGLIGLPTGLPSLDDATNGLQGGHLIIVAARPGMGKTSFALSLARNCVMNGGGPVAFFSQEQPKLEIATKLASFETGLSGTVIKNNKKVPKNIWALLQQVPDLYFKGNGMDLLHVDDSAGISISDLRLRAKRMKKKYGIKAIFCDYLQKYKADVRYNGTREEEISKISQGLKNIAKELNIPVIALSQLNRKVDDRADKRPMLSDLRESGSIEQEADMVMFLHRPEYYHKLGQPDPEIELKDKTVIPAWGKVILEIAKNRHGSVNEFVFNFENVTTLFYEEGYRNVYIDRTAGMDAIATSDMEESDEYRVPDQYRRGDIFKFINEERRKNEGKNPDF